MTALVVRLVMVMMGQGNGKHVVGWQGGRLVLFVWDEAFSKLGRPLLAHGVLAASIVDVSWKTARDQSSGSLPNASERVLSWNSASCLRQ